jgi:hypothetical protein
MRFCSFITMLLLSISCGQNGSGGGSAKSSNGWESSWDTQGTGNCRLSDGSETRCESLRGADGLGVDLLDTMIDVAVEINPSEIIFAESKVSFKDGRRIDCKTEVRSGEIYSYRLNGSSLNIRTEQGLSYNLKRLNETGSGLMGAWAWRGYTRDGIHIIRQITFVNEQRAILQTHCEL